MESFGTQHLTYGLRARQVLGGFRVAAGPPLSTSDGSGSNRGNHKSGNHADQAAEQQQAFRLMLGDFEISHGIGKPYRASPDRDRHIKHFNVVARTYFRADFAAQGRAKLRKRAF